VALLSHFRDGAWHRTWAPHTSRPDGAEAGVSVHRRMTVVFALTMVGLGVAMIAITAARGGGELGFVLGALFVAAGGARLYLQRAR
jgi:hypothetical protein